MKAERTHEILIVEDNEADRSLLKVLFANTGIKVNLHFAKSGMEGADFIFGREAFFNRPVPDLILMDLNIPQKDGRELMKEIKSNVDFCSIPVIILSTTSNEREISDSYLCGATAFLTKPSSLNTFQDTINSLCNFWFKHVKLSTLPESKSAQYHPSLSASL